MSNVSAVCCLLSAESAKRRVRRGRHVFLAMNASWYSKLSFESAAIGMRGDLSAVATSSLTALSSLREWKIGNQSMLSGSLPTFFTAISTRLTRLDISGTSMNGSLASLSKLRIPFVSLRNNRFSGTIPTSLGALNQVVECVTVSVVNAEF
jgi:hypothetical protein